MFIGKEGIAIPGSEPEDDEIYRFLKQYQSSSLHRHKAAIKAYLEYLDPDRRWPFTRRTFAQRRHRILVHIPSSIIPKIAAAGDRDDYMFVWTLFQLGCRISELRGILNDDITPNGVKMVTKGGWARLKPVTKEFLEELRRYAKGKKAVFPHTYAYYKKKLVVLGKAAGYTGKVNPHMFRHARAVDLLDKGMPLPYLQQFLGHANMNTTAAYTEITGGELGAHLEKVESGKGFVNDLLSRLSPQQIDQLRATLAKEEVEIGGKISG